MKKLNQTEISALASKILSEYEDSIKKNSKLIDAEVKEKMEKLWDKFRKSSDFRVLEKYDAIKGIDLKKIIPPIKVGNDIYSTKYEYTSRAFTASFGSVYVNRGKDRVSLDSIKNELILGQIEASDLNGLVEKVKKSLNLE